MDALRELLDTMHNLFTTLGQTVTVWDLIDILVIAFIFYRILTVMRRTSAGSVINAIILLLIVAWVSSIFNMKVLRYLFNQILQMGVIVLIILFQPELRKLFEEMSLRRFGDMFRRRVRHEDVEAVIDSVVSAAKAMTKTRTGALIVFEREIGLRDYEATGTRVDAIATSELVQNIFYHNSPLHDGALLIRDGRLLAASCMLPLSNNVNISRELGMRHRAGLGISERSDAVAVIVSEQSGTVSVAIDGMLKRHLSDETFKTLLQNELMQKGRQSQIRVRSRKVTGNDK